MATKIILPHGGYRNLLTYKKSDVIYQGTVIFVKRFLQRGDRTIDQMVQAARSESRAEDWGKAAYSRLAGANSTAELDAKLMAMTAELRRMAFSIKKRKGWLPTTFP